MSFSFAFGGDDIEDGGENDELTRQVEDLSMNDTVSSISPKMHTLQEMPDKSAQPQHQNSHEMATSDVSVPRRSVFDIRTQLMAEANPENENDNLLAGLESGDLTSGIYEGGFKTWECSVDLAALVSTFVIEHPMHIIELGAGSAIPSLVALDTALRCNTSTPVDFTLCDYNEDVLRLGTAPNVFLTQKMHEAEHDLQHDLNDSEIEDIDQDMINNCVGRLEKRGLSIAFISGTWGADLVDLVQSCSRLKPDQSPHMLILASETIYSPKSAQIFADTVMQLLRCSTPTSKAWVAAKKIYFGVGGSVDDFIKAIGLYGGSVRTILDVQGAGVGRVVLEIVIAT